MDRHDVDTDQTLEAPTDPGADATLTNPPLIHYAPSGKRLDTRDELPPWVKLRALHEGKWVAWSPDGETIVTSAERLEDMDREVRQAGLTDAIYEWIDPPMRQVTRP